MHATRVRRRWCLRRPSTRPVFQGPSADELITLVAIQRKVRRRRVTFASESAEWGKIHFPALKSPPSAILPGDLMAGPTAAGIRSRRARYKGHVLRRCKLSTLENGTTVAEMRLGDEEIGPGWRTGGGDRGGLF